MKVGVLCAFLMLMMRLGAAQVYFKGSIVDEKGEPIPFVHVQIEGTNKGTIANIDGVFQLKFQETVESLRIVLSTIGYLKQTVAITQSKQIIVLQEDIVSLGEVVVVPRDRARELVASAVDKILENYPVTEERLVGFIREKTYWEKVGEADPLYIVESVLETIKSPYDTRKTSGLVTIIEGRKYEGDSIGDLTTQIYGGPHHPHRFDAVASREAGLGKIDAFAYEISDTLRFQGQDLFEVSFTGKGYKPSGKFYILDSTFAIVKAEIEFDSFSPASLVNSDRILLKYTASYVQGTDLKWRLERTDYFTKFIKNRKVLVLQSAYATTDAFENTEVIPYLERVHMRDILLDNTGSYNADFWKDYTIISPDDRTEELFASKDQLNESKELAAENLAPRKIVQTIKRISSSFGFFYSPFTVGDFSVDYQNAALSFNEQQIGEELMMVGLTSAIRYQLKKGVYLSLNSSVPIGSNMYSFVDFEIAKELNINPNGRPMILAPKIGVGYQQIRYKLSEQTFDSELIISEKEFDSGSLDVFFDQRGFRVLPSFYSGVAVGGRGVFFMEAAYSVNFNDQTGLVFKETGQFFLREKSAYLKSGSEDLAINRDAPFQNQWIFTSGFKLTF